MDDVPVGQDELLLVIFMCCSSLWRLNALQWVCHSVSVIFLSAACLCVLGGGAGQERPVFTLSFLTPVLNTGAQSPADAMLRKKEQKDAELDRKIEALRKKNEALMKRYQVRACGSVAWRIWLASK